jgi:hypothetical protein
MAIGPHSSTVPILLAEGYRGFNLVRYGKKIYAIPQAEGAFDIERINRSEYGRWFSGGSLDKVKRLVDQSLKDHQS